jgi:hypothetical protein
MAISESVALFLDAERIDLTIGDNEFVTLDPSDGSQARVLEQRGV